MILSYGTNQLQLEWDTHVSSCDDVCYRVPHVATHVSFRNDIIITNLWPLFINFILPYPFCQSSMHAERC